MEPDFVPPLIFVLLFGLGSLLTPRREWTPPPDYESKPALVQMWIELVETF